MVKIGITDQTAIIIAVLILNYFLIYKRNRFIGGVFFFTMSFIVLSIDRDLASIGFLMIFLSFILLMYDTLTIILPTNTKKR